MPGAIVGLFVIVGVVPVDQDLGEARFLEQFAQLLQRPQPPLVGERFVQLRAILESEVDVVEPWCATFSMVLVMSVL